MANASSSSSVGEAAAITLDFVPPDVFVPGIMYDDASRLGPDEEELLLPETLLFGQHRGSSSLQVARHGSAVNSTSSAEGVVAMTTSFIQGFNGSLRGHEVMSSQVNDASTSSRLCSYPFVVT
jgi:hypothetical protein